MTTLVLDIWDNLHPLADYIITKKKGHFHYLEDAGLRNTDGEDTPPMGTPIVF